MKGTKSLFYEDKYVEINRYKMSVAIEFHSPGNGHFRLIETPPFLGGKQICLNSGLFIIIKCYNP